MIDRRIFLAGLAALTACGEIKSPPEHQKRMAITMDDFALGFDVGLSQEQRHENILAAFDSVGHKAAGFVTGRFIDNPWGREVVQDWLAQGHMIENHTWAHTHARETDTTTYLSDILKNQDYLSRTAVAADFFRFPFLDDGREREQQIELFDGLKAFGLKNAPVTIDSVDWFTSSRLEAALMANPQTDLLGYRDYYIRMCVKLANHWDAVARGLDFTSLPHLMLMHHNILNGRFLKDVLLALKADGWTFIDATEALAFRAYHPIPSELTNGRNWLTLKAIETETEVAVYPKEYLGFGSKEMDALGL